MHTCIYTYIHIHTYIHTHMKTYIYIHTHTHTCIHTYIQGSAMIINYLSKFGDAFESQRLKLEGMKMTTFPRDCFKFTESFKPLETKPLTALSVAHNKITSVCMSLCVSFVMYAHVCKAADG